MRRTLAVAMAAIGLIAGVSTAVAAIGKGTFAGKTSAGDPLGFRVDSHRNVYSFYFQGVTLKCSDGDQFDSPSPEHPQGGTELRTPRSKDYPIVKRKFKIVVKEAQGGRGYTVKGKFTSKNKSTGTLQVYANFDSHDNPDPNGSVHCDSGKLPFTAKRE